jgi:hypothetical protein
MCVLELPERETKEATAEAADEVSYGTESACALPCQATVPPAALVCLQLSRLLFSSLSTMVPPTSQQAVAETCLVLVLERFISLIHTVHAYAHNPFTNGFRWQVKGACM